MARETPGSHRDRLLAGALTCLQEKGYAHTTARDLVAASGTNLRSIGYHFGSKEALLDEALGQCFRIWTSRVEQAVFGEPATSPRQALHSALVALVDSFEEMRPQIMACVEAYAPGMRSETLRAKLADSYAEARQAGTDMIDRACADLGIDPPDGAEDVASLLMAIADGLMIQWLVDPTRAMTATRTLNALTLLSPFLTPDGDVDGRAEAGGGDA